MLIFQISDVVLEFELSAGFICIMFPRRHRSLIFKLLVGIPVVWILALMFFYSETKTENSLPVVDKPAALVQAEEPPVTEVVAVVHKQEEQDNVGVLVPPHDPEGPG